jgi:hypothetical protein
MNTTAWVWGGPFAGKTFLHKELEKMGFRVFETDIERARLPGWREELWRAWRKDHPLHKEWKVFDALHQRNKQRAWKDGIVIISHEPPPHGSGLHLRPSDEELAHRIYDSVVKAKSPDSARSRISAALTYYSTKRRGDEQPLTTDQVIAALVKLSKMDLQP